MYWLGSASKFETVSVVCSLIPAGSACESSRSPMWVNAISELQTLPRDLLRSCLLICRPLERELFKSASLLQSFFDDPSSASSRESLSDAVHPAELSLG